MTGVTLAGNTSPCPLTSVCCFVFSRVCLQNRDVRTYLSNPRRYATLKEAAETRLEQIEHDLEELFYAEELPDKLGQLCKGQVIIDEEAPLKVIDCAQERMFCAGLKSFKQFCML